MRNTSRTRSLGGAAIRAGRAQMRKSRRALEGFGVDDCQPGGGERTCCREQRVVLKVLVADRVKLSVT